MSQRVRDILRGYAGAPPGVLANLARLLYHGRLGGTGKLLVLPVDQGFEHGPARSFAAQPHGYDPRAHFKLAIEAGLSAHAAPLGALEAGAAEFAGEVPLILKLNNSDTLGGGRSPCPAQTASVSDALRLGCVAVGLTLYNGSDARNRMYEQARQTIAEAKSVGLPSIVWAYPRGGELSKQGETALDVVAYAAHIACQLGAHIVKVKPPTAHVEQQAARAAYAKDSARYEELQARVQHVMQAAFAKRRLVLFSGGSAKGEQEVVQEVRALAKGGASGCIMGRNVFQRSRKEALALLDKLIDELKNQA